MAPPPRLLMLLVLIPGALGGDFVVTYGELYVCALNQSTVTMNASYACAPNLIVRKIVWLVNPVNSSEPTDLRNEPGYSGRVWYSTDNQHYLAVTLSNVTQSDINIYYVRILTNDTHKRFLATPGPRLRLTDLNVIAPAETTEGQTAVLKCGTVCKLAAPAFVWFKDGRNLTTKVINDNELHLQPVTWEDVGGYSCAVRGYEHLPSPARTLSVRYPPKNIRVSIRPSEITLNVSVTLTCRADANPPVTSYTWFKVGEASPVGLGQNYSIVNFTTEDLGLYLCQAQNQLGAQNGSSLVTLAVGSDGRPVFLYVAVGVGVCVVAALLCAAFWFRSKKKKETTEDTIYQNVVPNMKHCVKKAPDASASSDNVYANL